MLLQVTIVQFTFDLFSAIKDYIYTFIYLQTDTHTYVHIVEKNHSFQYRNM